MANQEKETHGIIRYGHYVPHVYFQQHKIYVEICVEWDTSNKLNVDDKLTRYMQKELLKQR